jgi:diguanylate cyclase (GGDEF)-like protein/PAS domain S-box-containing protein
MRWIWKAIAHKSYNAPAETEIVIGRNLVPLRERDRHLQYKYILWVRWLLIIATSYLLYFAAPKAVFGIATALIFVHIASNIALSLAPQRIVTSSSFYLCIVPADTAFIALALWLTKSAETDFYLVFFLVVVIAAIGRNLLYVFVSVAAMSLCYGWLIWTTHYASSLLYQPGYLLRLPFLIALAIFVGHLTQTAQIENRKTHRLIREKRGLKRLYQRLQESERKFRALSESTTAAILVCQDNEFIYCNPVAEAFLKYGRDALLQAFNSAAPECEATERQEIPSPREIMLLDATCGECWLELATACVQINGRTATIGTAYEITQRKRAQNQLEHAAFHDFVTGLPNRAYFMDRLIRTVSRENWLGENSLALFYVDMDRFKWVNDSLGHEAGDRFLFEVGHRLDLCIRPGDILARLGGDEFGILLTGIQSCKNAERVANRIQTALAQAFTINGKQLSMSASIGIIVGSLQGLSAEQIVAEADQAMYNAKRQGGARHYTKDLAEQQPLVLAAISRCQSDLPV